MIAILVIGVSLFFLIIIGDKILEGVCKHAYKEGYDNGVQDMEEIYDDTTIKDLVMQELIKQKGEEKA